MTFILFALHGFCWDMWTFIHGSLPALYLPLWIGSCVPCTFLCPFLLLPPCAFLRWLFIYLLPLYLYAITFVHFTLLPLHWYTLCGSWCPLYILHVLLPTFFYHTLPYLVILDLVLYWFGSYFSSPFTHVAFIYLLFIGYLLVVLIYLLFVGICGLLLYHGCTSPFSCIQPYTLHHLVTFVRYICIPWVGVTFTFAFVPFTIYRYIYFTFPFIYTPFTFPLPLLYLFVSLCLVENLRLLYLVCIVLYLLLLVMETWPPHHTV